MLLQSKMVPQHFAGSGYCLLNVEDSDLTLNPISPFLQHRQASMRKMKVKRPEKDTATTAREEDQDSSLRGAPSVGNKQHYTFSVVFPI